MKIKTVVLTLALFLLATSVSASDSWKMKDFKGNVMINGHKLTGSSDTPILERNGAIYIPFRTLQGYIGGLVSYDSESKIVNFDNWDTLDSLSVSSVNSTTKDENLSIKINSAKDTYKVGEKLQIWSTLRSTSDTELQFYYYKPSLKFYLLDNNGIRFDNLSTNLGTTTLKPDDEVITIWDGTLAYRYYQETNDALETKQHDFTTLRLPAGQYTIGVYVDYALLSDEKIDEKNMRFNKLETKIDIQIE